jgi:predicted nucleic acid-binding protein
MSDIPEIFVLDGGVLLALALGEPSAQALAGEMPSEQKQYACTELALCELTYILCRQLDWTSAWEKTQSLLRSAVVRIVRTSMVWGEAARIKCQVPISLPDCFTIAASRMLDGLPMFARQETEIVSAVEKGLLNDKIEFLE